MMYDFTEITQFIQTASYAEVRDTLDFLLNECTLDQTPNAETVRQWLQILQQRGGKFEKMTMLCTEFLQDTEQ